MKSNCYQYGFSDKKVESIYRFCRGLLETYLDFQLNLRQIANTTNDIILKKILVECKAFQLKILKQLCDMENEKDIEKEFIRLSSDYNAFFDNCYKNTIARAEEINHSLTYLFKKTLKDENT